ncbi:MAG: hypothetical protein DI556_10460 [Rhodovulum sulfidophilum]|uniref:Uncharacterized protein n=1 Tax=Rhodovulum sulfidophilum TaxID=35806 RepID=A0A2W5NBK7_RHOSU|nr:MAG: hypothetical protein DI556_10460 [Rhodovulum sulfidophilum]
MVVPLLLGCGLQPRTEDPLTALTSVLAATTITVDLPPGISVIPGSASVILVTKSETRTYQERSLPLLDATPPAPASGGRTRIVFKPSEKQRLALRDFVVRGHWLDRTPGSHMVTIRPTLEACRTRSLSNSEPAVIVVEGEAKQFHMAPERIDLRAVARQRGEDLNEYLAPCP